MEWRVAEGILIAVAVVGFGFVFGEIVMALLSIKEVRRLFLKVATAVGVLGAFLFVVSVVAPNRLIEMLTFFVGLLVVSGLRHRIEGRR